METLKRGSDQQIRCVFDDISAASWENWFSGVLTWSHTDRAVQPHKMARGLKFRIQEVEGSHYIRVVKTKVLISFAVTAKLICVFVFAYAKKKWFSHNVAHLMIIES